MKTRFCPSPTGLMHLGNARTALFNALLARGDRGTFLLRIEDTDKERSEHKYAEIMQADLRWLGLEWQEGPGPEGPHAPYWQSKRQKIYDEYYETLIAKELAYPCFCSEEHLKIVRKSQIAAGKPPRYPGTCRNLTQAEVDSKLKQGLKPVLRFHLPADQTIVFEDGVHGSQRFATNDMGDFVIRRANGTAPFLFCNAIDDSLMNVTHVIRGVDHLTNTPRQIMLLQALELTVPMYVHISLITGADGAPLSKRHGSKSVQELRETGYLPEALVNYLARLGHYYENNAFMHFNDLANNFSLEHLNPASARFDEQQLLYWQKEAVMQLDFDSTWEWFGKAVHELVPQDLKETFVTAIKPNVVFPEEAVTWAKIIFADELIMTAAEKEILVNAGETFFSAAAALVAEHGSDFKAFCKAVSEKTGAKGKALYMPLRIALTSMPHGPELAYIFLLLGAKKLTQRFTQVLELVKDHVTNL